MDRDLEKDFISILTGEPHCFEIGAKPFYIYPVTLAKMFKSKLLLQTIKVNVKLLEVNPYIEAFRIVKEKKTEFCKLLSLYTTPNNYEDFIDRAAQQKRATYFADNLSGDALSLFFIYIMSMDRTSELMKHLGIAEEQKRMAKIAEVKAKNDSSSVEVGGKSIFGTFIERLHELGYCDREILYERPYTYLQLVLADKINSIFMTAEEMESLPTWAGGKLMMADNDSSSILEYAAKHNIEIN